MRYFLILRLLFIYSFVIRKEKPNAAKKEISYQGFYSPELFIIINTNNIFSLISFYIFHRLSLNLHSLVAIKNKKKLVYFSFMIVKFSRHVFFFF